MLVAEDPDDPKPPVTYPPLQYPFPPGEAFKHPTPKWIDHDGLQARPIDDPKLDDRVRGAAARIVVELGGTSLGPCDLRLDTGGRPHVLEIHPNCGVLYPPTDPGNADLCLPHAPDSHADFARLLVAAALRPKHGGVLQKSCTSVSTARRPPRGPRAAHRPAGPSSPASPSV